jgi:flavorubredoxin
MDAVKLREGIYWVGGIDWNLRNFHGYLTPRGSSYNAYLIIDEKVTLIDSVKYYHTDEMIERIRSVIDPSKIDYVICNHVEMDHSGAIPAIMELAPNATVFAPAAGEKGLKDHYKKEWKFSIVKSGDTLSIGKRSFTFVQTPMIHWPDNMVTYCPEEKILFSNDSFGQHIASPERFDDEFPACIALDEAKIYYGNIVLSYNSQVQKALEIVKTLPLEMIAPSHGIIWRSNIADILKCYTKWSSNDVDNVALVIYDTMWGSTQKMAEAIRKGFETKGVKVKMLPLLHNHISQILPEVVEAKYIAVGSPTMNSYLLPTVSGLLTYLKALSPKKRTAFAFGSYGWGGQSIDQVQTELKNCGFDLLEPFKVKYIPDQTTLDDIASKVAGYIA